MAVLKLSQIAAAGAGFVTGDFLVGVQTGTTDVLFSKAQIYNPPIVITDVADPATSTLTLTGGTALTTSQPVLNMTQTWNAGGVNFTGLQFNVINTASADPSTLMKLLIGATNYFAVGISNSSPTIWLSGPVNSSSYVIQYRSSNNLLINPASFTAFSVAGSNYSIAMNNATFGMASQMVFGWGSSGPSQNTGPSVDMMLTRGGAATLQFGAADAAAPVAQTLQVQSVVAGTNNTAGVLWTLQGSRGTGTGAGGDIAIKTAPAGTTGTSQNAAAEIFRFLSAGNIKFTGAANFSANGSVATVLGSIGPTGASTTVQKWLTFVDDGGATRYVPCF